MKGSKFLTELVDCSTFQKGKLNLIEAPTGCGKTYFALKHIPSRVKNPLYKVAFLIDTTNGKEQIMRKYHSAPATLDWQKSVETEMINFADEQHIVAMTYRSFMEDLAFDVTTCVKVAFDNGEIILNDQRNQRIIAERIMEELSKQIRDKLTLSI